MHKNNTYQHFNNLAIIYVKKYENPWIPRGERWYIQQI